MKIKNYILLNFIFFQMIVKENCNTKGLNRFQIFNKDNKLIYGAIMVIRDIIFIEYYL